MHPTFDVQPGGHRRLPERGFDRSETFVRQPGIERPQALGNGEPWNLAGDIREQERGLATAKQMM